MPKFTKSPQKSLLAGVPESFAPIALGEIAKQTGDVLYVCRDEMQLAQTAANLAFFDTAAEVLTFPAWDTVPYDRVSPNTDVVAKRLETLTRLHGGKGKQPRIVLTTVAALLQRVPPFDFFAASLTAEAGKPFDENAFKAFLEKNGYQRTEQVMEAGEYAVRGGIVDVFAPGTAEPLRLDLFGDELESIRTFDPMTQRTSGALPRFVFRPVSEVALDDESVSRFRTRYRELFGAGTNDILYESISEHRRFQGMEHWLPLFHDGMDTLFAFVPDAVVVWEYQADEAVKARFEQIEEFYNARLDAEKNGLSESGMIYHPVPVERMFMGADELQALLRTRAVYQLFPFVAPDYDGELPAQDMGGRNGKDFSAERALPEIDIYDAVRKFIVAERLAKKNVILTAFTSGSRSRIAGLLKERGVPTT